MAQHIASKTALDDVFSSCRKALGWLLLFSFSINLLVLTAPIYMMQVFDRVLASGRIETLLFLTIIAGISLFVMGVIDIARTRYLFRVGSWLERTLSLEAITSTLEARLIGAAGSSQPLRDLGTLRTTLSSPAFIAIIDAPWVPVFLVILWLMHPILGLVGLLSAVTLFTIGISNELLCRSSLTRAGKLSISALQSVDAALHNAEAIRAMGMLPPLLVRYENINNQSLRANQQASDLSATFASLSKSLRFFVQILILGAGALLVLRGELTSGGMIAASILLGRALAPVEQSIGASKQVAAARDALQRLQRLFSEVPQRTKGLPLPNPSGALKLDKVFAVAPGSKSPILNGVSFELKPGDVLGIIGPSAAGKSTLCKVVTGTWKPNRGSATLDGADIYDRPSDELGPYLGYLPQDVSLFAGTIAENIARLSLKPDPEKVIEAARMAGIHEIILALPSGYDTEIGDGGIFLSGGQRQRVGLARALYGKPKLIVLDEPNANLDPVGERALSEAILAAKAWGATVVMVAHHPAILRPTDKIMLMREGRIEAFGPREEILGKFRAALGSAIASLSSVKDGTESKPREVQA